MKKAQTIAETFDRCLCELENLCPTGREMSIVRTKLEEAAFFAKKAMANDTGEPINRRDGHGLSS